MNNPTGSVLPLVSPAQIETSSTERPDNSFSKVHLGLFAVPVDPDPACFRGLCSSGLTTIRFDHAKGTYASRGSPASFSSTHHTGVPCRSPFNVAPQPHMGGRRPLTEATDVWSTNNGPTDGRLDYRLSEKKRHGKRRIDDANGNI